MHEVLVNRLGGLSLPRKSVVRLTGRPDMTLDVYRGRKTTIQQQQQSNVEAIMLEHSVVCKFKFIEGHMIELFCSLCSCKTDYMKKTTNFN